MAAAQVALLIAGSVVAVVPWRRMPGWAGPAVLAIIALVARVIPLRDARTATHDLTGAVLFLLLAVPLAVLLDRSGFFTALAEKIDGGRHLVVGLWVLAALVTIVFNLDAAVVLLTPLYVRIAQRQGQDPVVLGFIPALQAALASSVLPVSNLTNLIAADRLDLGAGSFIAHLGLPSLASITVGGLVFAQIARGPRSVPPTRTRDAAPDDVPTGDVPPGDNALVAGAIVVIWLLLGFTVGERLGAPAWTIAAAALVVLAVRQRVVPWRQIPVHAAVLAAGLGVLATAAAPHLPVDRLLSIGGIPGELATMGVVAIGANAINNLPALLVTLPGLDAHHERVWAVLLGANLGPTLWVTGALSTLLWQATMRRLGHPISARRYAATAAAVGVPALGAAAATHVLVTVLGRI
ncbi:MAG: Citrate transporter [Acidimicrobiales bacterium]|nr:Citrate transporter [Acidimicrobiales bacterium]